ncbi:hypothetical protein EBA29_03773 [Bacillus velezensis]|uniref:Uncharacterized protein n=1 Tax=Bacillus amyloliquefaciens (strain Y2) TaxID=1155777 RepID=I2CBP5_BACAY|nr:hypothetical protein BAXH7_03987 [Bacillus amyloliquefaciens XH7]AFJ64069.1 hypothetical protein MUS_4236 [Bacillus velezensis YAU B9601-Y2]AGZ58411.1 hypothetical protein U471_37130 [Bacillus amyloliquefaciens CC178]ANF38633.1 hypothetical protein BCBMB205_37510 [Bacillus velezensis]KYC88841.1 hypothetical protein B4140_3683 [Bacillus amyloliquefaciens]GFR55172.1 hypothetical protein BAXH7_03987 [Bacillus sp. CN2]
MYNKKGDEYQWERMKQCISYHVPMIIMLVIWVGCSLLY